MNAIAEGQTAGLAPWRTKRWRIPLRSIASWSVAWTHQGWLESWLLFSRAKTSAPAFDLSTRRWPSTRNILGDSLVNTTPWPYHSVPAAAEWQEGTPFSHGLAVSSPSRGRLRKTM